MSDHLLPVRPGVVRGSSSSAAAPTLRLWRRHRLRLVALAAALLATLGVATGVASADERCGEALQNDVCLEATGSCPAFASPGLASSPWPVFQQNLQHTGVSPHVGPTCGNEIWTAKIKGKILSTPAIGGDGTLYFASAKYPVCALNPASGALYWCDTDNLG